MRRITQHKRIWIGNRRYGYGVRRQQNVGRARGHGGSFWIPLIGAALFVLPLLGSAMASTFPSFDPKPLSVKDAMAAVAPIPFRLDDIEPANISLLEDEPAPRVERSRTSYEPVVRARVPKNLPDGWRGSVLQDAYKHMGTRYRWGGTRPGAFDCSGFVKYVMNKNGIELPRNSMEMKAAVPPISRRDLMPGDLVFFSRPNHVGIYVGDGEFIHASSGQRSVAISKLDEGYYERRYIGSGRVAN